MLSESWGLSHGSKQAVKCSKGTHAGFWEEAISWRNLKKRGPGAPGRIKTERGSSKYLSKPEPKIKVADERLKENRRNERAAADGG